MFKEAKVLKIILITTFISMIFFLPLSSLYPLMTSSYFKLDSIFGSIVEFLYAFGMLMISLVMGKLVDKNNKIKLIFIGLLILGITSLICGILPSSSIIYYWIFAITCMFMGIGSNFYSIPLVSYMQETIKPELMGRAFSLWGTIMSLAMPIGLIVSGPISEKFGIPIWFLITGIVIIIITTWNYIRIAKEK